MRPPKAWLHQVILAANKVLNFHDFKQVTKQVLGRLAKQRGKSGKQPSSPQHARRHSLLHHSSTWNFRNKTQATCNLCVQTSKVLGNEPLELPLQKHTSLPQHLFRTRSSTKQSCRQWDALAPSAPSASSNHKLPHYSCCHLLCTQHLNHGPRTPQDTLSTSPAAKCPTHNHTFPTALMYYPVFNMNCGALTGRCWCVCFFFFLMPLWFLPTFVPPSRQVSKAVLTEVFFGLTPRNPCTVSVTSCAAAGSSQHPPPHFLFQRHRWEPSHYFAKPSNGKAFSFFLWSVMYWAFFILFQTATAPESKDCLCLTTDPSFGWKALLRK